MTNLFVILTVLRAVICLLQCADVGHCLVYSEGGCDWLVWDTFDDSRGIQNVNIHCSKGSVHWRQPYGGLRIAAGIHEPQVPFEMCFIATSHQLRWKISQITVDGLVDVLVVKDSGPVEVKTHEVCISSAGEDILLLAEIAKGQPTGDVQFLYDIATPDRMQTADCSPCSYSDVAEFSCSSNYVVRGAVEPISSTSLAVTVDKVYQPISSVFSPVQSGHYSNQITVPKQCSLTFLPRQLYYLMGPIRLNTARLKCALPVSEYENVVRIAKRHGWTYCKL